MWTWPRRRLPAPELAILAALAVALLLAACSERAAVLPPERSAAERSAAAATPPGAAVSGYAAALAALEQQRTALQAEAARYSDSWALPEQLVSLHLQLLQLTGDYRHYREAAAALAEAETRAGPAAAALCATQVALAFSQHRIAEAAAIHSRCNPSSDTAQARLAEIGAAIPYYQGDYPAAFAAHRALLAGQPRIAVLARLAQLHFVSGHREEALALLDRAERSHHGDDAQLKAWLLLQRAIIELESGRWEDARAWLLAAERAFPGWWLIREHLAEIHALLGEDEAALREYAAVVEETGHPEFMDAMAELLQARGDEAGAQSWIAKARARHDERMALLPEASYGHGLDHFLQHGKPAEALALARKNHALRPYGEAQIQLAEALLRAGERREAERLLRKALASGWRTAELHAVAAQVFAASGQRAEAAQQRAQALALNPRAAEQYGLP